MAVRDFTYPGLPLLEQMFKMSAFSYGTHFCLFYSRMCNATESGSVTDVWLHWQCDDELSPHIYPSCIHKEDLYVLCHKEDKGVEGWQSPWPVLWTSNTAGRWFRNSCVDWYVWHSVMLKVNLWPCCQRHIFQQTQQLMFKKSHINYTCQPSLEEEWSSELIINYTTLYVSGKSTSEIRFHRIVWTHI
jgi:hypothetical protein